MTEIRQLVDAAQLAWEFELRHVEDQRLLPAVFGPLEDGGS